MNDYIPGALTQFLDQKSKLKKKKCDSSLFSKSRLKRSQLKSKTVKKKTAEAVSSQLPTINDTTESNADVIDPESSSASLKEKTTIVQDDSRKRTIFVGNLPPNFKKKELHKLFRKFGKIDSVRFRNATVYDAKVPAKVAAIQRIKSKKTGNINAYVKFVSEQSVLNAIVLNGHLIADHFLRVDLCTSRHRKYAADATVFLGNLPFSCSDEVIHEHFADCGQIEAIRLVRDRTTGAGKGFGFVNFKDCASVGLALKLNNSELLGRQIRVTRVDKNRLKGKQDVKKANLKQKRKVQLNSAKPSDLDDSREMTSGKLKERIVNAVITPALQKEAKMKMKRKLKKKRQNSLFSTL